MSKRRWLATLVGVLVLLVAASAYTFHQKSQGEVMAELRQMAQDGRIVEQDWRIRYIDEEETNLTAIEKGFSERGVLLENSNLSSGWFTAFLIVAQTFKEETIAVYPGWHLKKMGGLFLPPEPEENGTSLKLFGFRKLAVVLIEGRAPGLPTEATRKAEVLFIG
ncbi:hypothetical protein HYW31_01010 [Candidatus Berkelbacteria bacterium]|nr:hypothetical protein [Candidatus Berkelbacteria bacterium]